MSLPPADALWLLQRVLPAGVAGETILGDLFEDFSKRAETSPKAARWWYRRAALSIAFRRARLRSPDSPDSGWGMRGTLQDARYAIRTLIHAPVFTLAVLATLTLGVGANTVIFSALNAVLLRPLPYKAPERLVRLTARNPSAGITSSNVSAPDFIDWMRESRSFQGLSAFSTLSITLPGTEPERVSVATSFKLFDVLGVPLALGAGFPDADTKPGPARFAILGYGLWRRRFGADPAAVGRAVRSGSPLFVTGVAPRASSYPEGVELWVPLALNPAEARDNRYLEVIGRLKPGVSVAQAQGELDALCRRLENAYPGTNRGWGAQVVPLKDYVVGHSSTILLTLVAGVGLLLIMACTNAASLFLSRAVGRRREVAIRAAIGAGRFRIARQLLTESLLLSFTAGAIGAVFAHWALPVLITMGRGTVPRLDQAKLDSSVLLFTFLLSAATGALFGMGSALRISRTPIIDSLKRDAPSLHGGGRTRPMLAIAQVAVATVLLTGAGMVAMSFYKLQRVDPGFQPSNLMTARVTLFGPRYRTTDARVRYFTAAIQRLSELPGVVSAAAVLNLPLRAGGYDLGRGFIIPGQPDPPGRYYAQYQVVTPNYFKTLGVPLLQGRDFSQDDSAGRPSVVIVNSTLARAWFGAANPIGKQLHDWRDEPAPREIIGVVGDLKTDLDRAAEPAVFVPLSQSPWDDMTFVVRTSLPVSTRVRRMTAALKETDPSQVAYGATTFDEILTATLARQRTGAVLFALYAVAGMLLAAVGVYSVMAFAVNDRIREMGLRLALGAQPADVRRVFILYGVKLLAAGLLAGSIASAVGGRILGRLLYGTGTGFASTATAIAVVAAIGLVSACVPIRRATAADPATILRGD